MAELKVNIGNLRMKNPVMTASGTFGYGIEFQDFVPLEEIGGIIVVYHEIIVYKDNQITIEYLVEFAG